MAQESLDLSTVGDGVTYKIETARETYYVRLIPSHRVQDGSVLGVMVHGSVSTPDSPRETSVQALVEKGQVWRINGVSTREPVTKISIFK